MKHKKNKKEDQKVMEFIAVYEKPSDYPNSFVGRIWEILDSGKSVPTEAVVIASDIETVRKAAVNTGFTYKMDRSEEDDQCVVETWW